VKGQDGNQFGLRMPDEFDRVLADVPCSGERHLLENKSEFEKWTVRRSQNLAVRQFSLLSSAWLTCKPGGRIVYSTCSISPIENDEIIQKMVKRRSVQILRPVFLNSELSLEKTEYGYQVLPDRSGFGPMYFSVLQK
jgi:16S rRNA C967 or C1407 C5-methylase (RsmB/RsmF family)